MDEVASIFLFENIFFAFGNNHAMREIGQSLENTKLRVQKLLGIPLLLKVRGTRGKYTLYNGKITALFPQVFCVQLDSGETKTFPFADVHIGGILFLPPQGQSSQNPPQSNDMVVK